MLGPQESILANRSPEQNLINGFVESLYSHNEEELRIEILHNGNCKSRTFADIEFTAKSGQRWAIEAKSNDSKDAHNTVHKIFGELLKETGRDNRGQCSIGILIPGNSLSFYSRLFQSINRQKFVEFGELIPVHSVFTYGLSGIGQLSWVDLYDHH